METEYSILIIDDEVQIRRLLEITLSASGYKIFEAVTGNEGIVAAASYLPSLILLDLGLPDADGAEILKKLREWYNKPIIILSVRSAEDDIVHVVGRKIDGCQFLSCRNLVNILVHPTEDSFIISYGNIAFDVQVALDLCLFALNTECFQDIFHIFETVAQSKHEFGTADFRKLVIDETQRQVTRFFVFRTSTQVVNPGEVKTNQRTELFGNGNDVNLVLRPEIVIGIHRIGIAVGRIYMIKNIRPVGSHAVGRTVSVRNGYIFQVTAQEFNLG